MAIKNVFSTTAIFLAVVLSGCVQTGVVTTLSPSTTSNNTNTITNPTFSKVTIERESVLNSLIISFNPTSNQTKKNKRH